MARGALALLVVLGIGVGALAATDLLQIRAAGQDYRSIMRTMVAHLVRGDVASAAGSVDAAWAAIRTAQSHAESPALRLLAAVPLLGDDVDVAIRGVGAAGEVTKAAELVMAYLTQTHAPLYVAGSVDPSVAADLSALWGEAEALLEAAAQRIEEAPVARSSQVAEAAAEVELRTSQGLAAARALRALAERLTQAAEDGGPLRALIVFTNGAELRATQGVPVLLARFELSDEIELSDLTPTPGAHPTNAVEAPEQFLGLFREFATSRLWSNLTMALDGPTIGQVGADMYEAVAGVEPDLVVVIDLVTTGFMLDAFPGVFVDGEEIDSTTLATEFLLDSYRRFPDGSEQNQYLLGVFKEVFGQLSDIEPDGVKLIKALQQAALHGRIVAWSPHPDIQGGLEVANMTRALGDEPDRVEVGVQNFAANKLDLFTTLDADLSTEAVGCGVLYRLEVETRDWTPRHIRPLLQYGSEENRWWVNLYLPPGAQVQQLYSNGEPSGGGEGTWGESPVASVFTEAVFFDGATVAVEWLGPAPESGAITVGLGATVSEHAQELVFEVPPIGGCG